MPGVYTRPWPRPRGAGKYPAPPPLGQLPPSPRRPPGAAPKKAGTPPLLLGADGRNSQPVESTAPSRVKVEGGSGSPSPGAPSPRGVRSAARGLEAAGCRDLKWCPCPGVGAGDLGRPEQSLHPDWARVSVRARPGLRLAPRAATLLLLTPQPRGSLGSPGEEEAELHRGARGGRSWVGPRPGSCEARGDRALPTALFPRACPLPCVVLRPEALRCGFPRARLGLGRSPPSGRECEPGSATRLSFPSGFCVHPAPSPQPGTRSRRRPSADGRDLIPPAAQLGCSLIAPGRRPLALLSAAGPGPGKGSGAPNRPGQFSLFLFSPFLWFWGRREGKGGGRLEPKRQGAAPAERPGRGVGKPLRPWAPLLGLLSAPGYRMTSKSLGRPRRGCLGEASLQTFSQSSLICAPPAHFSGALSKARPPGGAEQRGGGPSDPSWAEARGGGLCLNPEPAELGGG